MNSQYVVSVGFNNQTLDQLSRLHGTDKLIPICDSGPLYTPENSRQRLSYSCIVRNRVLFSFRYDQMAEKILRRFRKSIYADKLYDIFRRIDGRQFINLGMYPSPFEMDFHRSYLQHWIAKNILNRSISRCVFAYPPHSPFDICLYHMLRSEGVDVFTCRDFHSDPFYILFKNVLDSNNPDLLTCAVKPNPSHEQNKSEKDSIINCFLHRIESIVLKSDRWEYSTRHKSMCQYFSFVNVLSSVMRSLISLPAYIKSVFHSSNQTNLCYAPRMGTTASYLLPKITNFIVGSSHVVYASDLELPRKYAYFSLQIQPEATTEIFGGWYLEQLELLRELRSLLPLEYTIIVRDHFLNEATNFFPRPSDYAGVVESLPNTQWASQKYNSGYYIKNSLLVCSPSGTCCYEASVLGIPSIYGGRTEFLNTDFSRHISSIDNEYDLMSWIANCKSIHIQEPKASFTQLKKSLLPYIRCGYPYVGSRKFLCARNQQRYEHEFLDSLGDIA